MEEVIYNNTTYKIINERGLGFRKRALLAVNKETHENVIIFSPSTTEKYNDINTNKDKFLKDIDELELLYKVHKDKCKIIPIYTSKNDYIIITNYIEGRTLYRYLCDI